MSPHRRQCTNTLNVRLSWGSDQLTAWKCFSATSDLVGSNVYGLYRCLVLCQPAELNAAGTRPSLLLTGVMFVQAMAESGQRHQHYTGQCGRASILCNTLLVAIFNVRQHTEHVIDIGWTSVRPSVRHTLVLCRNGSTYRQIVFTAW